MPDPILLIYNQAAEKWDTLPLTRPEYTIGRTAENDIRLKNSSVSRGHARLKVTPGGILILDQNSSNGVHINRDRITPGQWTLLPANAEIEIGDCKLRLASPAQPASQPGPAIKTGRPARPAPPPIQRQQPPAARKPAWLPIVITLGVLLVCGCVVVVGGLGVWKFYPQIAQRFSGQPADPLNPNQQPGSQPQTDPTRPAPTPTAALLDPPLIVESLPAVPGGAPAQDSHGARLDVPAAALDPSQPASLESASLSPGMTSQLEQAYQIESLAYSISAAQDGSAAPTLSLPAPSPASRLAVLVDDRYAGVLDLEPQNGVFQITPFLGAPLAADSYPTLAQSSVPNRYFVVTPKPGTSSRPSAGPQRVSLPNQAADPDGKSCITEFWLTSHCWRNNEGTVYVFWESNVPAELKDSEYLRVIDMIRSVAAIMTSYNATHGFSNAAISKANPVYIIIDPVETEPTYSQKTGNIYLNWNAVASITGPENRCALAHELMHFTEDSAYNMSAAALSNPKAWWLEMAAENGAFLIDPICIDRNLQTYGRAVTKDNLLPFQSAAQTWNLQEGARYIQALQVYVSLCEGGPNCALSQASFVSAINSGSYPFDDASVLSAYQRSAKDMGLFLMGNPPAEANAAAHLPPETSTGGAFAEYIWLKATPNFKLDVSDNGKQIQTKGSEATVSAAIVQGGEYPLWVSNGSGMPGNTRPGYTAIPALLTIEAGTKLWYILDAGDPVFHDGAKELVLGPLSDKLGVGLVRLVAVAPDAAATLSAKVAPVDLSGDWVGTISAPTVTPIDCPDSSSSESSSESDNSQAIAELDFLGILSGYGAYVPDPAVSDGSSYIWEGTLPEGAIGESRITVKPEAIEVTYRLEIPKPTSESGLASWLIAGKGQNRPPLRQSAASPNVWWYAAGLASLALGWVGLKLALRQTGRANNSRLPARPLALARMGSLMLLALVLVMGASWLSGCFGMAIWGTFEGKYTFNKLEYLDPDASAAPIVPDGEPVDGLTWKLHEGTANNLIDLFIEVTTTDDKGTETTEIQQCKMSVDSSVEGIIGPADMVPTPDSGE